MGEPFTVEEINYIMKKALLEARKAIGSEDIPIGCVITDSSGNVLSSGHNTSYSEGIIHGHAEINAINNLPKNAPDALFLFVTMEPCPMCTGAILESRIRTVFYGTPNVKLGALGTVCNLGSGIIAAYGGFLADECSALVSDFFKEKRTPRID